MAERPLFNTDDSNDTTFRARTPAFTLDEETLRILRDSSIDLRDEDEKEEEAAVNGGFFSFQDLGRGILDGVRDAAQETINLGFEVADLAGRAFQEDGSGRLTESLRFELPDFEGDPETTVGRITKFITQFGVGLVGANKFLAPVKLFRKSSLLKNLASGAVADFTVFAGNEQNFSDLMNSLGLGNVLTDYLATDEDDSDIEGRFKNAIEGVVLGAGVEAGSGVAKMLFKFAKGVKNTRGINSAMAELSPADQLKAKNILAKEADDGLAVNAADVLDGEAREVDDLITAKEIEVKASRSAPVAKGLDADAAAQDAVLNSQKLATAEKELNILRGRKAQVDDTLTGLGQPAGIRQGFTPVGRAQFLKTLGDGNIDEAAVIMGRDFNFGNMDTFEDVFRSMNVTSEVAAKIIAKAKGGATETFKAVEAKSNRILDAGAEVVDTNMRQVFQDTKDLPARILASRIWMLGLQERAVFLAKGLVNLGEETASTKQLADFIRAADISHDTQAMMKGSQTQIARAMNALNIVAVGRRVIRTTKRKATLTPAEEAAGATVRESGDAVEVGLRQGDEALESVRGRSTVEQQRLGEGLTDLEIVTRAGGDKNALKLAVHLQAAAAKGEVHAARLVRTARRARWAKAGNELFVNNILSGPITHAVQAASNAAMLFYMPTQRVFAGFLGATQSLAAKAGIRNAPADRVFIREGFDQFASLAGGILDSFRAFVTLGRKTTGKSTAGLPNPLTNTVDAFRRDAPVIDPFNTFLDTNLQAISGEALASGRDTLLSTSLSQGLAGSIVDYAGKVVRLHSRLMMTSDEFFKTLQFRMKLKADAVNAATVKGLKNQQFSDFVNQYMIDPSDDAIEAAIQDARRGTFTSELKPGTAGKNIQKILLAHPMGRYIVPFVRTPTNILNFIRTSNPALAPFAREFRQAIQAGGAEGQLALAKLAMGTGLTLWAFSQAIDGNITGGGPIDKSANRQAGWLPYSFVLKDDNGKPIRYIQFNRLDPFAGIIGIAADLSEIIGSSIQDSDAQTAVYALGLSVARNLTSKSYLTGLFDFIEVMDDIVSLPADRVLDRFGRWAGKLVGNVTIPNLFAQTRRTVGIPGYVDPDPVLREARGIIDAIKTRIPGLSATLPPMRNIYGEAVVYPLGTWLSTVNPFFVSDASTDPVNLEVQRIGEPIRMPREQLTPRIKLTPEQYDRYVVSSGSEIRLQGKTMKEALLSLIQHPQYQALPDGDAFFVDSRARLIRNVISAYQAAGRQVLFQEFPDLGQAFRADRLRNALQRTPGGEPGSVALPDLVQPLRLRR